LADSYDDGGGVGCGVCGWGEQQLFARENATRRTAREREVEREGNDFLESKQQAQQQVERKQDEVLDDMSSALTRLGAMATTINTELKVQNQ
jgi:hypothetical protein